LARGIDECFEALEFLVEVALVAVVIVLLAGISGLMVFAFFAEAFGGFFEVFNFIAELESCGGGELGVAGEALAQVCVAEELGERFDVVGVEGCLLGSAQRLGGAASADGEVELGVEAEGFADGIEGGLDGGLAEPAAEEGDGGPVLGGRAGGGSAEGSEKKSLGAIGSFDVWHKCLLFLEL